MLAGRVPSNVVAIVMKAEPGTELACRARSYELGERGIRQNRGVISYYATRALAEATTAESWLRLTMAAIREDAERGRLPAFYQPSLQLVGPARARIAGGSAAARVPR